ncbi:MAG TPA: nucleotidyltransferase domain-containing protein [Bryobacteraceae bacterium]|nr:nucleotidyltransferase domain-containing protein [Bryobacteraceae bacterium]
MAKQRRAHNVRVSGSVARGEATDASDLDLLVAWEPGRVRDRILREATPL